MNLRFAVPLTMAVLIVPMVRTVPADVTDREVVQAIEQGVAFLKNNQDKARGNWPEHVAQPGGLTALCTLALLNSGVPPSDPAVARALDYLRGIDKPEMIYSVALRTMVFCQAEPKRDMGLINQNVKYLESVQLKGASKGAWAYSNRDGTGDNSNTQFALLALNEAERVGVKVSPVTWRLAHDYWVNTQRPDGGWGYKPGQESTGSMTCAGVCSVVITSGRISSGHARVEAERIRCCGDSEGSESVNRGLTWMARHFSVLRNPGSGTWLLYYLYGMERVGRLTGHRLIGNHDWYREGAEVLLRHQDDISDYWKGAGTVESNPLVGTSFALLFLSKGRRPVVIAKGQHRKEDDWDLHTGGVPNLTRAIERSWKRELTWQAIDLRVAEPADLLETPVLFLSGQQSLQLDARQKRNLRTYIEQSGFIFAEACDGEGCDGAAFDQSFRALVKELFPESSLRLLPPDHPVWYADGKVNPKYMRPLYGVDACCRTSIVYCPKNLSCLWELHAEGRESSYPEQVQQEVEAALQMGQNVVAYATNRVLKEKLDRPNIAVTDVGVSPESRGVLIIPKLQHTGGSDDAPNALANLMRYMRQEVEIKALSEKAVLPATDPSLYEYPILFAHGRHTFRWSTEERQALAEYFRNGGFLLADAICASPQFATAFRREMEEIFPGRSWSGFPPTIRCSPTSFTALISHASH